VEIPGTTRQQNQANAPNFGTINEPTPEGMVAPVAANSRKINPDIANAN